VPDFACMPDELIVDETIHQRAEIRQEIVDDLVALIDEADSDGWPFATRVQVSRIGSELFVTDGAHRVQACRLRNLRVDVTMTTRTREEAVLEGIRANGTHGAKRSPADTRKAVYAAAMLWPDWSNQVIANHMSVTAETVRHYRMEIQDGSQVAKRKGVDGIVRSATKTRKKKDYKPKAVVNELQDVITPPVQQEVPQTSQEVTQRSVSVVAPAAQITPEEQYEQYWEHLVLGMDDSEVTRLKAWVADFHGLVLPDKKGVLFPVDEEPSTPAKRRRKPTELEFEQFWKAYPRKTNKLKAKTAMDKAFRLLTGTLEPEAAMKTLIDAANLYADRCDPDPKFQMHPSSWLNAGRWSDSADSIGKKREQEAWAHGMFVE